MIHSVISDSQDLARGYRFIDKRYYNLRIPSPDQDGV